ncbi:hypothetical protein FRB90_011639 [Tulasnella sp. 427]|nr:hypothetical protein FRB90_011639 [Tulasnella sp. 427]
MPGAFGARSRSRVNVPQTIEEPEPEPEELDEIDFDDEDEDEEWDEEDLAEIDEEEVLPRSVAAKRSAQGLASRPGFVALPVPIPASSRTRDRTPSDARRDQTVSDARRDRTVSDARRDRKLSDARKEQVSGRPRTQSKASAPQSPPPPAPVSVQAQVQSAPKPSNPYQSRRILSMRDFDDQMEAEKQPAAPLPPTNPQRTPSQKKVKEAPRPLSSLNSDAVPTPVPSPSFAPAPLAPPKSKTPKPRPGRKNSVSSAGSKRGGARKRAGSQPKPIIVVNSNNDDYDDEEEEEEPTTPTVWRNRSQSNPATPATASTFGGPTSPVVRTRSGTKARIPIPQALLDGEQVVDIANPRQNVARSASQKSSKVVERVPSNKAAPTRPLPPQPPIDYSPRSYGRPDVATPTPSDGSRKSRTKSSNPNTPKMTYRQGLDDDGSGRMQRKEAEAFMKSSGRAFQGQACSIEVQVVDGDEGAEFGRKDGAYVDRSGSTRSKRSRRTSEQMYGSAVGSSPTFQGLPTPKSGHVRLRPSI